MSDTQAHLVKKLVFRGTITALTGLHIGGSEVGLQIGGADKIVVRNPQDNTPYIPGSSLKGRMRSLLERVHCTGHDGFVAGDQHGPCSCADCDVCRVFGVSNAAKNKDRIQAGRVLVRDAMMSNRETVKRMPNLLTDYTELKTEVSIDRLTSAANPRNFERVPPGAEFAFELLDEINAQGGILGRPVEIIYADTRGMPAEGRTAAERLISRTRSSRCSASSTARSRWPRWRCSTNTASPFMACDVWSDQITAKGYPEVFRNAPAVSLIDVTIGQWIAAAGFKNVAIIAEKDDVGLAARTLVQQELTKARHQVHRGGCRSQPDRLHRADPALQE